MLRTCKKELLVKANEADEELLKSVNDAIEKAKSGITENKEEESENDDKDEDDDEEDEKEENKEMDTTT